MSFRMMNSPNSFQFEEEDSSDSDDSQSDEEDEAMVRLQSQNPFDSALQAYLNFLEDQPLVGKSVTCAFVCALGAALGNVHTTTTSRTTKNGAPRRTTISTSKISALQRVSEIGAFALYGGLVGGPLTHFWTQWLARNASSMHRSTSLLLDQLIAQPPMLFLMHLTLDMAGAALREGPQAWNRSFERTGQSLVASWRFWPAAVYIM